MDISILTNMIKECLNNTISLGMAYLNRFICSGFNTTKTS